MWVKESLVHKISMWVKESLVHKDLDVGEGVNSSQRSRCG